MPLRLLALWVTIPYAVFSFTATKMPSYVAVAAPAVFLIEGWFWWRLAEAPLCQAAHRSLRCSRSWASCRAGTFCGRVGRSPSWTASADKGHQAWDRVVEPNAVMFSLCLIDRGDVLRPVARTADAERRAGQSLSQRGY
jgi:hypothetical protein